MATVEQVLVTKGRTVHIISKIATVFEAIATMAANNVGSLVVFGETAPCGMITERDYLRRIALEGRSSRTTYVKEIMSRELIHVHPETDLEECMGLMTRCRIRHLPVLDGDRLVGLVSIGDLVKQLVRDRESTIQELTYYIQGRYA